MAFVLRTKLIILTFSLSLLSSVATLGLPSPPLVPSPFSPKSSYLSGVGSFSSLRSQLGDEVILIFNSV
jgi:hypothetical protein